MLEGSSAIEVEMRIAAASALALLALIVAGCGGNSQGLRLDRRGSTKRP
jgi:hypothetical protein